MQECNIMHTCKRRSKTKKFLSISFSASRRRGGGRRREKNARKFFGFCTRESASVSEAHWFAFPRNRSVRFSFKPPRAPRVRLVGIRIQFKIHSNFVQYTPHYKKSFFSQSQEIRIQSFKLDLHLYFANITIQMASARLCESRGTRKTQGSNALSFSIKT